MAQVSIMTMVFGGLLEKGAITDVDMLRRLDEMGYDGVELHANRILGAPDRLKEHVSFLKGSKLKVTCMDAGCNFINRDAAKRAEGVRALRNAISIAPTLGCPVILAAGSQLAGDITPQEGRQMTADGLNACMDDARELGVTLAIEDFGVAPTLQCKASDCLEILAAVPGLAFVFDTGNFYFAGEEPVKNLESLANRTRHVHLKDWVKSDKPQIADVAGCALGAGFIPNTAIIKRFLAEGKMTSFSIEMGAPGDPFEGAKNDLETVRKWLAD